MCGHIRQKNVLLPVHPPSVSNLFLCCLFCLFASYLPVWCIKRSAEPPVIICPSPSHVFALSPFPDQTHTLLPGVQCLCVCVCVCSVCHVAGPARSTHRRVTESLSVIARLPEDQLRPFRGIGVLCTAQVDSIRAYNTTEHG